MEGDAVLAIGRWKGQAPKRQADKVVGHQVGGQVAPSSLGIALSGKRRQPKPRSVKDIDETVWSTSMLKALEEMQVKYGLNETIEEYYIKMCTVGKFLLADEVHRKTQSIYDYKATKLFQRSARSVLNREAPGVSY